MALSDLGVLLSVPVLQSGFVTKEQADPVVPGVGHHTPGLSSRYSRNTAGMPRTKVCAS